MKTPASAEGAAPARTRPVLRRLPLILVTLAFAVFAASALAGSFAAKSSFQLNGSITNTDLVVSGPAYSQTHGNCTTVRPVQQLAGNYHYKVYRFRQLGSIRNDCVWVSLLVHSGTATAAGYTSVFNPSNPTIGFVGSVGSLGAGQDDNVPGWPQPQGAFDIVVFETTPNGGATYTLVIDAVGVIMTGGGPTAAASLQSFRASSAPKGVLVRWRTRSEHDALGFNLYRGDRKKVRLTRGIVRASGDGRGHTYSYLDRTARKGKTAPYYLEVVQRSGSKIMFGPALFRR